jgi:hypothetical protein
MILPWRLTPTGCPPRVTAPSRRPPSPPSTCPNTRPTTRSSNRHTPYPSSLLIRNRRHTTSSPLPIHRSLPPRPTPLCLISLPRHNRPPTFRRGLPRPQSLRDSRAAAAVAVGLLLQQLRSNSSSNSNWPCTSSSSRRPTRLRLSTIMARRPWWPIWRLVSRTRIQCIATIRPPSQCFRRAECFPRRLVATTPPPWAAILHWATPRLPGRPPITWTHLTLRQPR